MWDLVWHKCVMYTILVINSSYLWTKKWCLSLCCYTFVLYAKWCLGLLMKWIHFHWVFMALLIEQYQPFIKYKIQQNNQNYTLENTKMAKQKKKYEIQQCFVLHMYCNVLFVNPVYCMDPGSCKVTTWDSLTVFLVICNQSGVKTQALAPLCVLSAVWARLYLPVCEKS